MISTPKSIATWQMTRAGKGGQPGEMTQTSIPAPALKADEALVEVAGCGVCHTDLGYFYDGVPTIQPLPLTLGHEISGTVVDGPEHLVGKSVIVPAVLPCGDCPICDQGRGNRCLNQKMPGNSLGIYGGFASHIPVPARDLCVLNELKHPLSHYAVVADAVTTPYQAAKRAGIGEGDNVVVIGIAGGVGSYMGQIVKAMGAGVVIGIDLDDEKLQRSLDFGADYVINASGMSARDIKQHVKKIAKEIGVSSGVGWKIFECTGTASGQEVGLELLSYVGTLVVVGFGVQNNQYMLSKLMVYDAHLIGTWGCLPHYYPDVVEMIHDGRIAIEPFVQTKPMSQILEVIEAQHTVGFDRRQVLEPDFGG